MGIVYAIVGINKYGLWDAINGPKPGFFPTIAGFIMILCSLIALAQSFGEKEATYRLEDMSIVLAVALAIGASYLIGLVPAMLLMTFVWLKFYEKVNLKSSLIVTAVISAIVIGVFVVWLNVYFPTGLIGLLFE
jgi:hypothetical protein